MKQDIVRFIIQMTAVNRVNRRMNMFVNNEIEILNLAVLRYLEEERQSFTRNQISELNLAINTCIKNLYDDARR